MKNTKKVVLISFFSLFIFFSFLIPSVRAQEWIYDGVDTERFPGLFVYPSERYYYNFTGPGIAPEVYMRFDIVKGNISDEFMGSSTYFSYPPLVNGTCIFGDVYMGNSTSGQEYISGHNLQIVYWNETVGIISMGLILIPVENTGEATAQSFEYVIEAAQIGMEAIPGVGHFEHNASYPTIYSCELWNSTHNNAYYKLNYTENGHLIFAETSGIPNMGNITLMTRPAQMSPVFTFSTDDDVLAVNSTDLTFVVDITDADNNNDGTIDTDYQYRIYNGTSWTAWAVIPATIDYSLGTVPTGNYDITMEVKNMYGVASDQIQIQYTAPSGDGDGETPPIPGYSVVITSIALLLGITFIIQKNRKKL